MHIEDLDPTHGQLLDELVVLALCLFHPHHIVEEQFVAIRRSQAVQA